MLTNKWSTTTNTRSNELPTTESILAQAMPGQLGAPDGWRSEILDSSSPIPTDMETDFINTNTNSFEKYKTLNTSDAPPMIFSSTNEANRFINEIPSTTVRSSSRRSEYSNRIIDDNSNQEQKVFLTNQQQNLIRNRDVQDPSPVVLHKTLPNNTVTYQQNVSVRYLQPPTPPPPGPIIIREVRPPPPNPPSPVQIRQRPPPPVTPPPIVIREKPPPTPCPLPSQVVEKLLPSPPRPPRRMIVERFASCPPKPPDVVIERWLPYRRTDRRRILFERAPTSFITPQEPNLLILHDRPNARVHKEFINQGVARADPITYLQRYGSEIDSWHYNSQYGHLVNEATRALPPPHPLTSTGDHHDYHGSYSNQYPSSSAPVISNVWERMKSATSPAPFSLSNTWDRMRSVSPPNFSLANVWDRMRSVTPPHFSVSNAWDRMRSASPPPYSSSSYYNDSPYHYPTSSPHHYNDYACSRGDIRTMIDVTPSWGRFCQSRLPSYEFSPSYPSKTMQVNSDGELDYVLSGLKRDRVPSSYRFY